MEFMLVLSLKNAALTSISATLWKVWWSPNHTKDLPYVTGSSSASNIDWKEKAQSKVKERVQKLIIPENLKKSLSEFTDAVGSQLGMWLDSHIHNWRIVDKAPETFVWTWTSVGTIDLRKTANLIVCDNAIDIGSRFRMACFYCLEEQVLTLSNQIDEKRVGNIFNLDSANAGSLSLQWAREELSHFISDLRDYFCAEKGQHRGLDHYPDKRLDSTGLPPDCSPIALFEKSLERSGFCEAAKFFYLKSLETQNNETIVPIMNRALKEFCEDNICYYDLHDAEILCFLLNHMNEDQQIQVLRSAPPVVLGVFLKWPWTKLFIEIYQLVGHLLSEVEFPSVLNELMEQKILSCQHHEYEQIFIHMWQKASDKYRNFVYGLNSDVCEYFENLCKYESWYACNLLLEGVPEDKRTEKFSYWFPDVREYFTSLILEGKWVKIECFLSVCRLSNLELNIFRNEIIKHSHFSPDTEEKVKILLNKIIDAFIKANEKRCIENGENTPKRFCVA